MNFWIVFVPLNLVISLLLHALGKFVGINTSLPSWGFLAVCAITFGISYPIARLASR